MLVDERGAIIDGVDGLDAFRQTVADLSSFAATRRETARLFSPTQHEHGAEHDLATVLGRGAGAQFLPKDDIGNVAHAYRHAIAHGNDNALDVLQRPRLGPASE